MRTSPVVLLLTTSFFLTACTASDAGEDGEYDSFGSTDGKADGAGLSDAQTAGVLALVNTASKALLDGDVGLSTRAATNITTHRAGNDKILGTADDDDYDNLAELDAVPYVGPKALADLLAYAEANGYVMTSTLGPDSSFQYCPTQHLGTNAMNHPVMVCDTMFSTRPFIHLPADSGDTHFVGIANSGPAAIALTLTDRDDTQYVGVNGSGAALSTSGTPSPMPAGLEMPTSRGMFTVYEVVATAATFKVSWTTTKFPALDVTDAAPVVVLAGKTIDTWANRAWEGTVAGRVVTNGVASWDDTKPQAVRIEFSTLTKDANLTVWATSAVTDADGETYDLGGTITNLSHGVTDSTGACLPAFSSLGDSNAFAGASNAKVSLHRLGSMHFGGDEELVLAYPTGVGFGVNGMGSPAVVTPINFIQTTDAADVGSISVVPHGLGYGNVITIHPVLGDAAGGASCTPAT